ncbi:hypothetical protein ACTMU2_19245 [Cupriavidus basilensis]
MVVENKPGGNGFIGVQTALNAPADGYIGLSRQHSTLSTNAATFRKLPHMIRWPTLRRSRCCAGRA